MKISIQVFHNGRKYGSIEDATLAAVIDGMKETVEEQIQPFKNEIINEGGEIILDLKGDRLENISGELVVKNISEDLKARILAAVNKS